MNFLDEADALIAIRKLLAEAGEAKLAVAFWGKGAIKNLGLDRPDLDLTIICNLDSGACNPKEIRLIKEMLPEGKVRSNPRLHAKVYWTPNGAVIGSSNASTNGLAVEGETLKSWAEANILIKDQLILDDICEWFNRRCDDTEAYNICETHLEQAQTIWETRANSAAPGAALDGNLFSAYRHSPHHPSWSQVRLSLWTEWIDKAGEKELKRVKKEWGLDDYEYYQGWNDKLRPGEWLIDIDLSDYRKEKAKYEGIFKVPSPKIESESLCFVRCASQIKLPGFGNLSLTDQDIKALESVAKELLEIFGTRNDPNALISMSDVIKALDSAR